MHGEAYLDWWGPLYTTINGVSVTGVLVMSNYRVVFVRTEGASLANAYVQFAIPLDRVFHVVGDQRKKEGVLVLNHLELLMRTTPPQAAGALAASIAQSVASQRMQRLAEIHAPPPPAPPPPAATGHAVREREIIREIVKLPCRYCGGLVEMNAPRCPSCGASLK